MSVLTAFAMMGLVLLGIIFLCFGAMWLEKKKPGKGFDERQKLVHYRAHRLSNLVGIAYMMLILLVLMGQVESEKIVEPGILILSGLLIKGLVFNLYSLINEAMLPLSQKPLPVFMSYFGCGCMGTIYSVIRMQRWPLSLLGDGSISFGYLMIAFCFFSMALMYLIQWLRR